MNEYDKYNPWYYLGDTSETMNIISRDYGYFFSSIFLILKVIGIFGAVITLIFAIVRYATSHPHERVMLKDAITGKIAVLIFIFGASYFFSLVMGIILTL